MGKKKSVVLMTLLTIVMVVLCALVAFPSFPIAGTIYSWEPIAMHYDFGADLGGGYYTYYYPNGVISETEYTHTLAGKEQDGQEAVDEYKASYKQFGGLYLSTDEEIGVLDNGEVTEEFKTDFNAFVSEVEKRFEQKGYSDYRVAVVDNYSVRVEVPKAESQVAEVFSKFAITGEVTLEIGDALVDEMKEEDVTAKDLIKNISVGNRYKTAYLKVEFTGKGKELIKRVKADLPQSSDQSAEGKTLDIKIGGEKVVSIYKDSLLNSNAEARPMAIEQENAGYIETYSILLNSALNNPVELELGDVTGIANGTAIRQFAPVYGKAVVTLLYIALGIVLLAVLVLPFVKMGRFGIVSAYGTLSYFIVAGICFKYITGGVFEFTLGTVLVFLAGLVLMNVLQMQIYGAIKKESETKSIEASVKNGYKKTLWGVVDVYAVVLLGAIVLLFAGAGLFTTALQAIICIVTGAFCNLLWLRAINYMYLSASKDKYKYFRFVREDDEDDE